MKTGVLGIILALSIVSGAAIGPYYVDDAGRKLATLLRDHISVAAEVVKAAKADDKAKLDASQAKWSTNGKEIAAFLAGARSSPG